MRPALLVLALAACTNVVVAPKKPALSPLAPVLTPDGPPFANDSAPVLIRKATVMTAAGAIFSPGHVLLRNGVIEDVGGGDGSAPDGATIVEREGAFVTPGLIDTHSHLGVYPLPFMDGNADGNEATNPITAEVWAEHGFWPQDPGIPRAWTGGITTVQVLPGSANLVGGRAFPAHLVPATSARAMRFPNAPLAMKMACGENPKRVYGGERHSAPGTRMGNLAGDRAAFQRALEYRRRWQKYQRDLDFWNANKSGDPPDAPDRNLQLEMLAQVLDGNVLVQCHCYRADDMSAMLDLSEEFGFKIRSFHHALEAYKIRDRLAKSGVAVSTWSDWWGFKMEAFDGVPQNAAMLAKSGVRAVIHSDSESEIRHLNQEAAKARASGKEIGIELSDDEILRWVTANPAWVMGIDNVTGTLEMGKRADVVVWDRMPFSVYAHAAQVYIDGRLVFDRAKGRRASDFELGIAPEVIP